MAIAVFVRYGNVCPTSEYKTLILCSNRNPVYDLGNIAITLEKENNTVNFCTCERIHLKDDWYDIIDDHNNLFMVTPDRKEWLFVKFNNPFDIDKFKILRSIDLTISYALECVSSVTTGLLTLFRSFQDPGKILYMFSTYIYRF